jgi:carboxylesterase type B
MRAMTRAGSRLPTMVVVLALGLVGPAPASALAQPAPTTDPLVVATDTGPVRGATAAEVDGFLGIPYAEPPVGQRRWARPAPVRPWSEVRPAVAFGNPCPVTASSNGPRSETEDCLFVNVQRPAGLAAGAARPVYVFIHGGGLINGSSNQVDGAALVRQTGVVAVSMNYRLGRLGFLALPELTAEQGESGNYGLLDQQAALAWVQRNIAAFGGDPAKVTIGGESAGGWSVCSQLVAPSSTGLFGQAVIQSGACPSITPAEAEAGGSALAGSLGCADATSAADCLRAAPVATVLDDQTAGSVRPVRDTPFLPTDPLQAVQSGRFSRVRVLIGATRDEGRTFAAGHVGWTEEQYLNWVRRTFGSAADAVLARYSWPTPSDRFTAAYLSGAIMTDFGLSAAIGGCPNRQLTKAFAAHTPTWAYEFDHRTGPGLTPEPAGYEWGAGHAAELAYLYPGFDNGTPIAPTFDPDEQRLATDKKQSWGNFVGSGDPGLPGSVGWEPYEPGQRIWALRAGGRSEPISDAQLAAEHQCEFWDNLPAPPPRF